MSKKEKNLKIFSKNRNGYTPRKSTERTVANYHLTHTAMIQYYIKFFKGGVPMLKFLSKIAEKYAKNTNTACFAWCVMHQPKMPASLIKKD